MTSRTALLPLVSVFHSPVHSIDPPQCLCYKRRASPPGNGRAAGTVAKPRDETGAVGEPRGGRARPVQVTAQAEWGGGDQSWVFTG